MAPVKKTAKTAAKPKAAAKKPAAKKPAVKKPAAKTTAAKKPAAKKPAAKTTTAAKKPAVKKPAVATTVKKPAAKTTSAKLAGKADAVKKPAAKTSTAKKLPAAASNEVLDPNVKFRNLFEAFEKGKLPFAFGYIVSSFFNDKNAYSIYEIVSYAGVKEIFPAENGLQFVAGGKKLYVLVEHDTYSVKYMEPVSRAQGESIPKRFNELETIIAKNQTRIMVAKEPNEITGSFTILKPFSLNFSVVFYFLPDVYKSLSDFFEDSLNMQRKVPQSDAKKAANLIASTIEKTMGFKGEFE
jgi:hypothetical protein